MGFVNLSVLLARGCSPSSSTNAVATAADMLFPRSALHDSSLNKLTKHRAVFLSSHHNRVVAAAHDAVTQQDDMHRHADMPLEHTATPPPVQVENMFADIRS
jgi:hypothetical protein